MRNYIIKCLTLVFIIGTIVPIIKGQVPNGDFSFFTFTGGDCVQNPGPALTMYASPFVACANSYWEATHGSPEIFNDQGQPCATMWTGRWDAGLPTRGEGIKTKLCFKQGQTYHLRIKVKCSIADASGTIDIDNNINHVYAKLGNGVPTLSYVSYNSTSLDYAIPNVSNYQTVVHYTNFANSNWQTIDTYFTANDDYDFLWIYPEHSNGPNKISVLFVDDVVIGCIADITYSNHTNLPAFTMRSDYIQAINNTQVLNGQNVTFRAGEYIRLAPSFSANYGSEFAAYIQGCSYLTCIGVEPNQQTTGNDLGEENSANSGETEFNLYPNPTSGQFTINLSEPISNATVEIYDLFGKSVYKKEVEILLNEQMDIGNLNNGIYLVTIGTANGFYKTFRILKE